MQALTKPCQQCHKPMNGGVYRAAHICPHCHFEHAGGKNTKRKTHLRAVTPNYVAETPSYAAEAPSYIVETAEESTTEQYQAEAIVDAVEAEAAITETPEEVAEVEASAVEVGAAEVNIVETAELETKVAVVEAKVAVTEATEAAETEEAVEAIVAKIETTKPAAIARQPEVVRSPAAASDGVTLSTKPASEFEILAVLEEASAECVLSIELTPDLFDDGKFIGAKSEKVVAALKQGKKNALAELRDKAEDLGANMVTDIVVKNGLKMVDAKTANITVSVSGQAVATETAEDAVEI